MRRPVLVAVLLAMAAAALVTAWSAGVASRGPQADGAPSRPIHLALGDSVAAGAGATDPATTGYVAQLAERLRRELACAPAAPCPPLQLVDLSTGGATTTTLLTDQLPRALQLLRETSDDDDPREVRVVTLTIGGNDVFRPVVQACLPADSTSCLDAVEGALSAYADNLDTVLGRLRGAADPDTVIVATAYANALPGCPLQDAVDLGNLVLEGGERPGVGAVPSGLNDITRDVAARHDVRVAEAFGRLGPEELAGDCLHPNQAGHDVYAEVFADVVLG